MAGKCSTLKERFIAFQATTRLDVLVPDVPECELPDQLEEALSTDLSHLPQRQNLFFDEQAAPILVLRTSLDEDALKQLLPSLQIQLSAHATDAVPQGSGNAASASGKHDLASLTITGSDVLTTIPAERSTFAIWKPTLHLPRPRIRLQRPAVYFTAYLNIRKEALAAEQNQASQILTPYEPLPANSLAPLRFDAAVTNCHDFVPPDLLTKGSERATMIQDSPRPVRGASKRAFPIIPALFARIRYSNIPDAFIASLHVETSRLIPARAQINDIHLDIAGATTKDLGTLTMPAATMAGDELVALYKLVPKHGYDTSACGVKVKIVARLYQNHRADVPIELKWQTQVDLSKNMIERSYRWSRPLSSGAQSSQRPSSSKENPKSSTADIDRTITATESGIVFNFTASRTVSSNGEFHLHVQCVNNTIQTRRFTLLYLQPRKSSMESTQASHQSDASLVAKLFNAPSVQVATPCNVMDLDPDVRVGPISPGTSYEVDMRFRAMMPGTLKLRTIRIVDLDSRRTVDVRDIPDIVALDV